MGGVPMLLLVAALGVDYGWQPDGGGGVEYVIQVQPDQWERVKELGEISSVIDPQVQGRVSRVIIRVGNDPLPRTAPARPLSSTRTSSFNQNPNGASNENAIAAVDLVPMPIPEMSSGGLAVPIPGGRGSAADFSARTDESVMKPDPGDPPTGGGFSLPSSLQDAANGFTGAARGAVDQLRSDVGANAQNQFDSAMNQLRPTDAQTNNAINQLGNAARDAAGALANRNQPPPFTGTDPNGAMARARSGGPSTDPASAGSAAWSPIDARRDAAAELARTASAGRTDSNAPANQPGTNSTGGYGTTGNLGRQPESLNTGSNSAYTGANGAYPSSPFSNPQAPNSPAAYPPDPRLTASVNPLDDPRGYGASVGNYPPTNLNTPGTDVDPRLSAAQRAMLPLGAFSFNAQNVPVDRQWNPIDSPAYVSSQARGTSQYDPNAAAGYGNNSAYPNQTGYPATSNPTGWGTAATSALGQPTSNGVATRAPTQYPIPASYPNPGYGNGATERSPEADSYTLAAERYARENAARENAARDARIAANAADATRLASDASVDLSRNYGRGQDTLGSNSDRSGSPVDAGARLGPPSQMSIIPKPTVVAQPFFNGMLLFSIVGNFYLFFWLKNMRDQFRDLVAAKRMAQSNSTAA